MVVNLFWHFLKAHDSGNTLEQKLASAHQKTRVPIASNRAPSWGTVWKLGKNTFGITKSGFEGGKWLKPPNFGIKMFLYAKKNYKQWKTQWFWPNFSNFSWFYEISAIFVIWQNHLKIRGTRSNLRLSVVVVDRSDVQAWFRHMPLGFCSLLLVCFGNRSDFVPSPLRVEPPIWVGEAGTE